MFVTWTISSARLLAVGAAEDLVTFYSTKLNTAMVTSQKISASAPA